MSVRHFIECWDEWHLCDAAVQKNDSSRFLRYMISLPSEKRTNKTCRLTNVLQHSLQTKEQERPSSAKNRASTKYIDSTLSLKGGFFHLQVRHNEFHHRSRLSRHCTICHHLYIYELLSDLL